MQYLVRYPLRTTFRSPKQSPQTAAHIPKSALLILEIIDIDAIQNSMVDKPTQVPHPCGSCDPRRFTCKEILVEFSDGKDKHTLYPFGLYKEHTLPWNYRSVDNSFYIQAKVVSKMDI